MSETRRRSLLTAFTGAALGTGLLGGQAVAAPRTTAATTAACPTVPVIPATRRTPFVTNTDLYRDPQFTEGIHYARRYKRQARTDADLTASHPFTRTTVLALHGGGIEPGTSEIALGIAGYDPSSLAPPVPSDGRAVHDYWMFEGLLGTPADPSDPSNSDMHITSTRCDDLAALSMAGGSANVISVHGCDVNQLKPAVPGGLGIPNPAVNSVLVGGLNLAFKALLHEELRLVGFTTYDGDEVPALGGTDPDNPCNRGLLRQGAQLELTLGLRKSMFSNFTRPGRPSSITQEFKKFVNACRQAIHRMEQRTDQAHY